MDDCRRRQEGKFRLFRRRPDQGAGAARLWAFTDRLMHFERMDAGLEIDLAGDFFQLFQLDSAERAIVAGPLKDLEVIDEKKRRILTIDDKAVGSILLDVEKAPIRGCEFVRHIGTGWIAIL